MPTPLLVVTSDEALGEHLRQCLEETGRFGVRITGEQDAASAYVQEKNCTLAFLDAGAEEQAVLEIGQVLRLVNPEIRFIVVSEVGWHSKLEKLFPLYYLSKPFERNDLLKMMETFFPASASAPAPVFRARVVDGLPWLSDVSKAAQHLTRLTLESAAQAALITRTNQLWAYAGQLPQSAASELADIVARYWDRKEQGDLVRFVRMTSTNADHMLYATRLSEGMVLALVFDAETPFSKIRTQAGQLVRSLSAKPAEAGTEHGADETGPQIQYSTFSTLLSDIPSPNPSDRLPPEAPQLERETGTAVSMPPSEPQRLDREMRPALSLQPLVYTDQAEQGPAETQVGTRQAKRQKKEPVPDELSETRPRPVPVEGRKIILEPVSPSVYNLCYACLLVPRFPQHYLTGDLSDRLSEWVPQICIAFGWRLEYISVRPEYLQGIVNVPPATSPGYLMRILRHHTSEKIFTEFPRFKLENPSGDFWAPGYLIMGGSQPAPAQLVKDFIGQTRQRQGIL